MSESQDKTAQPPARVTYKRLAECKTLREAFQTEELRSLVAAAAPKFIDPVAMLRTWVQACSKQPLIYEADMRQALGAFQSLAFLGLQPNTHLNLAHIIPFKRKLWNIETRKRDKERVEIQVIIGYAGYIELAHRSGVVKGLHADVVYDPRAEDFEYEYGTNQHLRHRGQPPGFKIEGEPLYAYAWFKLAEGDQFEVMPWTDVMSVRNRSQAYRNAMSARDEAMANNKRMPPAYSEAPWIRDAAEMGKKTVLRRGMKWLPKCPELRAAAALEDAQDGSTLDWGPVIDGKASPMDGDIPETEERDDTTTVSVSNAPTSHAEDRRIRRQAPKVRDVQPEFEAGIVDEYGEIVSDVFTDPIRFARALVAHWQAMPDKSLAGALIDHNADALLAVKVSAEADKIAAEIVPEEPDDSWPGPTPDPDPEPPAYVPPIVPGGDGEWSGYPNAIKAGLKSVPDNPQAAMAWAEAQRETLTRAPAAQRLLAVNAIALLLSKHGFTQVAWIADMIRPKADDPDERQVQGFMKNVAGYLQIDPPEAALDDLQAYAKSNAVQAAMSRLRATKPELYQRAYDAFDKGQATLLERIGK